MLTKQYLQNSVYPRIDKNIIVVGECFNFTLKPDDDGIPQIGGSCEGKTWGGKVRPLVWERHNGIIPTGYNVSTTCNNILCINIKHLQLITGKQQTNAAFNAQVKPTLQSDWDRFNGAYDINPITGCWNWKYARRGVEGYGAFEFRGKQWSAHRVSYVLHSGQEIPKGLVIRHKVCHDRSCVNFAHLAIGTHKDNAQDRKKDGRDGIQPNKTSLETIAKIRGEYVQERDGEGVRLANKYGLSESHVSAILRGDVEPDIAPDNTIEKDLAFVSGRRRGEMHHRAKLTAEIVKTVRQCYGDGNNGVTVQELADKYGVGKGAMANAIARRSWGHIP